MLPSITGRPIAVQTSWTVISIQICYTFLGQNTSKKKQQHIAQTHTHVAYSLTICTLHFTFMPSDFENSNFFLQDFPAQISVLETDTRVKSISNVILIVISNIK